MFLKENILNETKEKSSIKQFLKPKKKEEYEQYLKKLSPIGLIRCGFEKDIEFLIVDGLRKGGILNFEQFKKAIIEEYTKVIKEILKTDYQFIPLGLKYAVLANSIVMTKLFLDAGVKPTLEVLKSAAMSGDKEIVEMILKRGKIDPSEEKNSALSLAMYKNNYPVIKTLLEDPRVRNKLTPQQLDKYRRCYNLLVKESLI